jgi:putative colanic acid biosynthesis acetyltransferase WcaF
MSRTLNLRLEAGERFPYSARDYLRRALWRVVYILLVRPAPPRTGAWYRFWLRVFGARAGRSCFTPTATIKHPWWFSIGDHSTLGDRVTVYNLGPVSIGSQTVLSQDVYVCAGTHDYTSPLMPLLRPPIRIGDNVWICAGAFIGPGVTIGDGAVVGARSVVFKDVPPWTVVAGNPARVIKQRLLRKNIP